MLRRSATALVRKRLREYPAVALVGPRQCGKTTLARALSTRYFDLEQPAERLRLDLAWPRVVAADGLVILDEAQSWPEVFPRLRGAIDARRRQRGRFLILGSIAPALMQQVSESLAGRLALVELTPLHAGELPARSADRLWHSGGYPDGGVLRGTASPGTASPGSALPGSAFPAWQTNYLQLMAQRDLPAWGLPGKPSLTFRLFQMLAAHQGTVWNASQLGQSLGVSYHTVQTYVDFLEGAFLVRRLPPFAANLRKRLVKAPKIYWRDSGLLHALLGLGAHADLRAQPWIGASWEGWVIEQILAVRRARGEQIEPYFFRTHDGWEADLVLRTERDLEVIEIKLTTSPAPADFARLDETARLIGGTRRVLLSRTPQSMRDHQRWSVNLRAYLEATRSL